MTNLESNSSSIVGLIVSKLEVLQRQRERQLSVSVLEILRSLHTLLTGTFDTGQLASTASINKYKEICRVVEAAILSWPQDALKEIAHILDRYNFDLESRKLIRERLLPILWMVNTKSKYQADTDSEDLTNDSDDDRYDLKFIDKWLDPSRVLSSAETTACSLGLDVRCELENLDRRLQLEFAAAGCDLKNRFIDAIWKFDVELEEAFLLSSALNSGATTDIHAGQEGDEFLSEPDGRLPRSSSDSNNSDSSSLPEKGTEEWFHQKSLKAANARHDQPGGSREKQKQIRDIWATGKYSSRDRCAEEEYLGLKMSFSAARKALRNTPNPKSKT